MVRSLRRQLMYSPAAVVQDADCSRRRRLATCSGLRSRMRPQEYFSQSAPAAVSLHVMGKPETQRQRKQPSCKFTVCNLFSKPSPGVVRLLFFHICQNFLWQIRLLLTFEHFHQPFPVPHKANSRGVRALLLLYTVQRIWLLSS